MDSPLETAKERHLVQDLAVALVPHVLQHGLRAAERLLAVQAHVAPVAPADLLVAVSQEPLEVGAVLRVRVSSLLPSDVANENASVVFNPDGIGIMNVVALDDKSNNGARADSSKRRSMPAPNGEERSPQFHFIP